MTERASLYRISPSEDATVAVEVFKSGLLGRKKRYTLFFENFRGEMRFDSGNLADSQIQLFVKAGSLVCRDRSLSDKRRRLVAEFARKRALKADVHPEIRFVSTSIRPKALRGFVITGPLSIGGITREVKVNMSLNGTRSRDLQLDADAIIRLSDFGLPRPSALFGLIATRDEAVIHIRVWAMASENRV